MELYIVNYTTSSKILTFIDSVVSDPVAANNRKVQLNEKGYIATVRGPVNLDMVKQEVAIYIE